MKQKIYLEDTGQDFLWFEIKDDLIVKCGPYQQDIWEGKIVVNTPLRVGDKIVFDNGRVLKHLIVRVDEIEKDATTVQAARAAE